MYVYLKCSQNKLILVVRCVLVLNKEVNKVIKVKNLVKKYGDFYAVNDISFDVEDGQIVGLLGPNGAGKSTTMNIMTGYISSTSGEVKIRGYDILEEAAKAKANIGYLPEIPPLYKDMTVEEYLYFVAELKFKKCNKKELAAEVMDKVDVTDVRHKLIKKLSKGYQQRVGLAAALIGNPPLLILDEPMVGLDPAQTKQMRQLIKSLKGEHTIILSSHILTEINEICDRIIIISNGTLTASDSTEHITEANSDKHVMHMTLKGSKTAITKALEANKAIESIEFISEESEGIYRINAHLVNDKDIRDDLFGYLAENKIIVYNMEFEKLSLEEVFIKLTNNSEEVK